MDYASTTPPSRRVLSAMEPFFSKNYANPSAIYSEGTLARSFVENSRRSVARMLGSRADEVVFTGSGTESINLAIIGLFGKVKGNINKPHLIVSSIEHPAVLESARVVRDSGGEVTMLKVNSDGVVSPSDVKAALKQSTFLVSIMQANNEIGSIQPIKEIGRIIREFRSSKTTDSNFPYFHTDSGQSVNYCPVNVNQLGVSLLSLDASKIHGPKGVGILYIKRGMEVEPIIVGGGQEGGIRSGTENVAGIVGMAEALVETSNLRVKESKRLTALRDYCISEILKNFPKAKLNGPVKNRLPNNVNICFTGIDAEFAVIKLNKAGIMCSSGSSCRNLNENSMSYVVSALGRANCAKSSLRFSFGRSTGKSDIDFLVVALKKII